MNTALTRFRPLIPAGGVGSRLWPLSRAQAPKFLLDLTDSGKSLLRDTYDRLIDLSNGSVMVVTGTSHANAVTQQIPELRASDLVLEPSPKDSAAAIGLACAIIHEREPDAIIGSFAADHVINPVDEFQRVVTEAVITAASGKIVTIGITPTEPSSAFGYIRACTPLGLAHAPNALAVESFVEKPDSETAQKYLDSGDYTWNAGMFVAPVSLMLQHLEKNEPELYAGVMKIAKAWDTPERESIMEQTWGTLPKTAIDYAVAPLRLPENLAPSYQPDFATVMSKSLTRFYLPLLLAMLRWSPAPSAGTMWEILMPSPVLTKRSMVKASQFSVTKTM